MGFLSSFPRTESADRRFLVGASDAPIILGLSPWQTPFGLWVQRTQGVESEDSNVTKRGRHLEQGLLRWTAEETGATEVEDGIPLSEPGLSGPEPFMSCRPDGGLLIDRVWEGAEIKTSRLVTEWGKGEDEIPLHYLAQVQWQLACMPGCPAVRVGAYLPVQDQLKTYRIERDEDLIASMIESVGEWFYKHIVQGIAPDVDASPAAASYLHQRFGAGTGRLRNASPEETRLVLDLAAAKAATKAAKSVEDLLANRLREAIGDDDGLTFDGAKATWKEQAGANRVDTARLKAEYPEVAAAVTVQGEPTRVLRLAGKALKGAE